MSELIETLEDGVLLLVMNRPEAMNALSSNMMDGLLKGLRRGAEDPEVGCVVLRGAGDKAFCAGGDVKAMAAGGRMQGASHETKIADLRARMRVSEVLHDMPKPTIAVVNGVAA
ncbi:enoyl-CoA hydratase/isomerase family protein, partial [Vineibacter terrae]